MKCVVGYRAHILRLYVGGTYKFIKRVSGMVGISNASILFFTISTYGTSVLILFIQMLLAWLKMLCYALTKKKKLEC